MQAEFLGMSCPFAREGRVSEPRERRIGAGIGSSATNGEQYLYVDFDRVG